jgi:ketosteroid isomerase-like protein
MAQQDLNLVWSFQPSADTDLSEVLRDDAAWEALKQTLDPSFTNDCTFAWVAYGGRIERKGLDGLRAGWLEWLEPWDSYTSQTEEVIDASDRIVVLVRERGRRRDTTAEVEMRAGGVCRLRDGKVASIDFYASREEALAAAGVPATSDS